MLECTVTVRCKKSVSNGWEPEVTKENGLEFRVKADTIEELKSYSETITLTALGNLDHVIEKTEFDTKSELQAMKEAFYGK